MEFEWDEAKRQSNLAKHGIDFVDVRHLFDGRPLITTRSAYRDEEHYSATGIINGRFVTVIWTRRNTTLRIISARRASDAETRSYRTLHGGRA